MALRYPNGIYPRGYGFYPDEQVVLDEEDVDGKDESDANVKNESKEESAGGGSMDLDLDAMLASLSKQAPAVDPTLAASIDDLLGTLQSGPAVEADKEEAAEEEEEAEPEDEDDLYGGLGGGDGDDGDDMYGDLAGGEDEEEEEAETEAEAGQMVVDGPSTVGTGAVKVDAVPAPTKPVAPVEEELTDLQRLFRYSPPFNCWEMPDQPSPVQDIESALQDLSFERLHLISQVNNGASFSSVLAETLPQLQKLMRERPSNGSDIS
jgi:hypothetical protein